MNCSFLEAEISISQLIITFAPVLLRDIHMRLLVLSFLVLCSIANAYSMDIEYSMPSDTVNVAYTDSIAVELADTAVMETPKKKNFFNKVIDYFADANKKNDKKFDFSVIGGPHYSSDTQLGLGLVGAGLYRIDRSDTIMQPSNVSIFGDVSTVGFFLLGVRGNNFFPKDRFRLNYNAYLYSFPSSYWGIGYEQGDNDGNQTDLKYFQARFRVDFMVRVVKNLYVGPLLIFDFAKVNELSRPNVFGDQPQVVRNYGFGAMMSFDNRDVVTNPHHGVYAYLTQMFRPSWMWNDYAFSTTEFGFSTYHKVWRGGILAYQLTGRFNFGDPAWAMMSRLGGSNSMRGYYEGRYRDKHMLTTQLELRQNIYHRIGGVVWVGAGNVFHNKETFKKILPNYGLGFRWEFKKNVNVRLDYGFGKKGQSCFLFNINEAF